MPAASAKIDRRPGAYALSNCVCCHDIITFIHVSGDGHSRAAGATGRVAVNLLRQVVLPWSSSRTSQLDQALSRPFSGHGYTRDARIGIFLPDRLRNPRAAHVNCAGSLRKLSMFHLIVLQLELSTTARALLESTSTTISDPAMTVLLGSQSVTSYEPDSAAHSSTIGRSEICVQLTF